MGLFCRENISYIQILQCALLAILKSPLVYPLIKIIDWSEHTEGPNPLICDFCPHLSLLLSRLPYYFCSLSSDSNSMQSAGQTIPRSGETLTKNAKVDGSSTGDNRSSPDESSERQVYTFLSMICNPYLLDQPTTLNENISRDIFQANLMKSIRSIGKCLVIELQEKKTVAFNSKRILDSYKFADPFFREELLTLSVNYLQKIPLYLKNISTFTSQDPKENFFYTLKKLPATSFMAWNFALSEAGPKLKFLAFSEEFLSSVSSTEHLALEIEKYKECALDFLSNSNYKIIFTKYFQVSAQLMECQGDVQKQEQIVKQNTLIIENEVMGKKTVTFQIKVTIPQPTLILFQNLRKISQRKGRNMDKERAKKEITVLGRENIFNTLHKITKLPSSMNPESHPNMCGYMVIPKNMRRSKKKYF